MKIFHVIKQTYKQAHYILSTYSLRQRILFSLFLGLMIIGAIGVLVTLNNRASVVVPAFGGSFAEGILGTPRYINPVLARTDADRDITRLVYAGLMKREGSMIVPDIAESYTLSEDETQYTFTLRDDIVFHDNTPLDADDVLFTIESIQNITLESPHFVAWRGVTAQKIDDYTVEFTLQEPYAGFLQNTTVGILPMHIWRDIPTSQFAFTSYNIEPIGAGPFTVQSLGFRRSGSPDNMTLRRHKKYHHGRPYLQSINLEFFGNTSDIISAFRKNNIDAVRSLDPAIVRDLQDEMSHVSLSQTSLPRVFGVFFNADQNDIFSESAIVTAINTAIHKESMIERVLSGYGTALNGPFPPHMPGYTERQSEQRTRSERIEEAERILEDANWTREEDERIRTKDGENLSFTLSTVNVPELIEAAQIIENQLEAIGFDVAVNIFDIGMLEQEIIRPRLYDALLFGQVFNHDTDIFAYWHSSYRNDPGLNIALYADARSDTALSSAYRASSRDQRQEYYETFIERLSLNPQSIFLYSPDFLYLTRGIDGIEIEVLRTPADRFNNVHEWHTQKQRIWRFLTP